MTELGFILLKILDIIEESEFCKPFLKELKQKPNTETHEESVETAVSNITTAADSPVRRELVLQLGGPPPVGIHLGIHFTDQHRAIDAAADDVLIRRMRGAA